MPQFKWLVKIALIDDDGMKIVYLDRIYDLARNALADIETLQLQGTNSKKWLLKRLNLHIKNKKQKNYKDNIYIYIERERDKTRFTKTCVK